jgi:hypothetical protein
MLVLAKVGIYRIERCPYLLSLILLRLDISAIMMRLHEVHDQVLRDLLRFVPAVVLGVD